MCSALALSHYECDPNSLNQHFASTAKRILGPHPDNIDSLVNLLDSLPIQVCATFCLNRVSPNEILKEIQGLRSDCSRGADHIPVKILKPVVSLLVSPLTHIINTCIDTSAFPEDWKVPRISPIPEKDHTENLDDYFRPVSILPVMSPRVHGIETANFLH